jgi:hypothetical protein
MGCPGTQCTGSVSGGVLTIVTELGASRPLSSRTPPASFGACAKSLAADLRKGSIAEHLLP